jgi:hypothetical protein
MDEYGVEVAKAMTDKNGIAKTQIVANKNYQIEIRDGSKSLQSTAKMIAEGASGLDCKLTITLP